MIKEYFYKDILPSLISCGVGLAFSLVVLVVLSGNPVNTVADFFTGVFASPFYFGSLLNTSSLFIWAAVGACLAMRSGSLNLGGEGQVYLSGFVAAVVFANTSFPFVLRVILACAASCFAGFFCTAVPALLKRYRGSSELLTSFLVSAFTIPLVDAAIAGPFRDSSRNLLATPYIPEQMRLKSILPPSALNMSFFLALFFCLAVGFFLFRTKKGRDFSLCGKAPKFARYAGVPVESNSFAGLVLSGICHGLTGFFAVWGTYYTCHSGFYVGMGWNALSCALIARSNPFAVIPASFLLAWIFTAVDRASMVSNFSFDMESLVQGIILFCVSAQFVFKYAKNCDRRRKNGLSV